MKFRAYQITSGQEDPKSVITQDDPVVLKIYFNRTGGFSWEIRGKMQDTLLAQDSSHYLDLTID